METIKSPQISVIIPAYKAADHLHVSADSLLKQTMTDFEVIIVEDCSGDGGATLKAAQHYADSDPRFRVMQTDHNCGCGRARNVGIDAARGEYILAVDADDYLHQETFAALLELAREHNADVVCYNNCKVYPGAGKPKLITGATPQIYNDPEDIKTIALQGFCDNPHFEIPNMPLLARMYKRSLLIDNNLRYEPIDHLLSEDTVFGYKTMQYVKCCVFTPNTYYFYVQRACSITRNVNPSMLDHVVKSAEYFEKVVCEQPDAPENAIHYIWSYVLTHVRAYTKQMFMSDRPMSFKRQWMKEHAEMPIFRTIYEKYPLHSLSLKHRLGFVNFYKKRFALLYAMVVGQEKVRALLGKR